MAKESAAVKAKRLLCEGRVIVTQVDAGPVAATCRGDGTIHQLGYRDGAWWCTCPARSDQCSHLIAVRHVTAVDLPGD